MKLHVVRYITCWVYGVENSLGLLSMSKVLLLAGPCGVIDVSVEICKHIKMNFSSRELQTLTKGLSWKDLVLPICTCFLLEVPPLLVDKQLFIPGAGGVLRIKRSL